MKIYTKKGDTGLTSMYGGGSYHKDDVRIEAYGTIDELNALIGQLVVKDKLSGQEKVLLQVQNTLFDIGSNLATRAGIDPPMDGIEPSDIQHLEEQIDHMTAALPPLKNFILPGGNEVAALCHICRTVCRRAERRVVTLHQEEYVDQMVIRYLNRLSDYFFTLARFAMHKDGAQEVIWTGRNAL